MQNLNQTILRMRQDFIKLLLIKLKHFVTNVVFEFLMLHYEKKTYVFKLSTLIQVMNSYSTRGRVCREIEDALRTSRVTEARMFVLFYYQTQWQQLGIGK